MDQELRDAIQSRLSVDEPVMVTAFVVVVEYVDADGQIGVETITDEESPTHRLIGLLSAAEVDVEAMYYSEEDTEGNL